MNDYNMLPSGVWFDVSPSLSPYTLSPGIGGIITGTYPSPRTAMIPSRPVADCGGCGARDYRAGRCSYCGRQP